MSSTGSATDSGVRRERLSPERLVAAARDLLVAGGPSAVVVREVARVLSVAPSAMYKHVAGRDELLDLLVTTLYDEATAEICAARDQVPADKHRTRLFAATEALRSWARAHPAEFTLVFATPMPALQAPDTGATSLAALRFGVAFFEIFLPAMEAGRLRVLDDDDLPPQMREQFEAALATGLVPMTPGQLYPVVVGFQRMLGLIAVEVAGQMRWAMSDPSSMMERQFAVLADELLTPGD